MVKEHDLGQPFRSFQCDLSKLGIPEWAGDAGEDFINGSLLLFAAPPPGGGKDPGIWIRLREVLQIKVMEVVWCNDRLHGSQCCELALQVGI